MKKFLFFVAALMTIFVFNYCTKDIVATDITKKTVNILAPGNGVHTPYNAVTFWWDEIKGTDKYQLQIVSPSFSSVVSLIADTSVTTTKLTLTLSPGTYQWRVRATNNSGSTAYSTRSLVIDTTSNLAYVTIALLSPADSLYTNQVSQTFSWASVPAATGYEIYIMDHTGATLTYSTTTSTTFNHTITQTSGTNATYSWKVRAQNSFSNTAFTSRTLFINLASPTAPVQVHPVNTGTLAVNDSLTWTHASGISYDSLFVAKDSNYTTSSIKLKLKTTNTFYKITTADTLTPNKWFIKDTSYYWKLKSTDKAGNTSPSSLNKKFKAK